MVQHGYFHAVATYCVNTKSVVQSDLYVIVTNHGNSLLPYEEVAITNVELNFGLHVYLFIYFQLKKVILTVLLLTKCVNFVRVEE